MSEQLIAALKSVVHRLGVLAAEDEQLRDGLRRLARTLLAVTEPHSQALETAAATSQATVAAEPAEARPAAEIRLSAPPLPPVAREPLPELTFRRASDDDDPAPHPVWRGPASNADLPLIEARCRLKAEALRWAAARARNPADDVRLQLEQQYRELIRKARELPDCFLWMCHLQTQADPMLLADVAGSFEALAASIVLARNVVEDQDTFMEDLEEALQLVAEAQSALRSGVYRIGAAPDRDQLTAFNWLRTTAVDNQVFIPRHMKQDDPADPRRWADLLGRVQTNEARVQESRKRVRHRQKLLGKVKHKTSLVAQVLAQTLAQADGQAAQVGSASENGDGYLENWRLLAATVDELVADGVPPSNAELRELLLPVVDDLPELPEVPAGFQRVLHELDRYLANRPGPERGDVSAAPSPEVQKVAALLKGRSLVLIGGERRPAAHEALKRAFGLQELFWMDTREHMSIAGFEAYVARPEVALVVLAIRWSSHSFGEVKEFCDRHGKPLVRLPAGYNPNQVAVQVIAQCSERLEGIRA